MVMGRVSLQAVGSRRRMKAKKQKNAEEVVVVVEAVAVEVVEER